MSTAPPTRPATAIDEAAERYFDGHVALSPVEATTLGVSSARSDRLDDYSPAGWAAKDALRASTLAQLEGLSPVDETDRVTLAAMRERLGLAREWHAAGLNEMSLNNIDSPLQNVRDVLDLMPTATEQDWVDIRARLHGIPTALRQWLESLRYAAGRGRVAARRQVLACVEQGQDMSAEDGHLARFRQLARLGDAPLPESLERGLADAAAVAAGGFAECVDALRTEILPVAREQDACGRDTYQLCSRQFLGTAVDLEDTYAWGLAELERIRAEMTQVADALVPSGGVPAAIAELDTQPRYLLQGTGALRSWMQERADEAVRGLADVHFDIPEPVRRIECLIAPTHTGGIYYTGPSDDFTRPGRMWWSVPRGVNTFSTWRELTTVYHEGVPGHHLQVAQTTYRSALLNRWRRLMLWTSGHGEGWALYAERLMRELGYLDDPGNLLGMLEAQSLRAARVVIDIGVHCGFAPPPSVGDRWTYDAAWAFLNANSTMRAETLRFELDRYLGWPGQAPSYKIGERLWLDLRAQAQRRAGAGFDLRDFHLRALNIGGVGLDTLRQAVLGEFAD